MKFAPACCFVALSLAGCAATKDAPPVALNVGNGVGSQYGNYAAQVDGEMRDAAGERCVVYNWDRPLASDLAVRVKSASCESRDHPGWMSAREISRTVIPMSASNLKDEESDAGQ
ncbi:MAG TPA: hypothetical protein VGO34_04030 [Alphaproteobacteria bacterium]|jgi:hypothetical protein